MLSACSSCPGLVPSAHASCPHCGAAVTARTSISGLARRAAGAAAAGAMAMTLMACYGYVDGGDYYDGGGECAGDFDCPAGQICSGGLCVLPTTSSGATFEVICDDEKDDDFDGDVDCEDADCAFAPECVAVEVCDNGADDDGDGYVDCEDTECPVCPATEIWCGNLIDDDQDGLFDCEDPDCADACTVALCGDGQLGGSEECDDGDLVAGDGCSGQCELEVDVFCATLPPLLLGSDPADNSGGTSGLSASCVPAGGREVAFTFTAPAAGTLDVSIESAIDLGIYILEGCAEGAPELACAAGLAPVSTHLETGVEVTVVVDAAAPGAAGPFLLTSAFTPD